MNATSNTSAKAQASKTYRYYSPSLSRHMLPAVDKHLPKIGAPLSVEARCEGKGTGWYELIVRGTLGKLVLRGCSWGYMGEGSRATRDVLVRLGVSKFMADNLAFTTPNHDVGGAEMVRSRRGKFRPATVGKVYFKVKLERLPELPYDVRYWTESRQTVTATTHADALLRAGVLGCDGYCAVPLATPIPASSFAN